MKIKRTVNGQEYEFELTPAELQLAKDELNEKNYREDVERVVDDLGIYLSKKKTERAIKIYTDLMSESKEWCRLAREAILRAKTSQ